MMRTSYGSSHHPPDDEAEGRGHGGERRAEQPQRAIEDGPGLHAGGQRQRRTAEPIGERLLPDDDVTAAHRGARVLAGDLARQMEPERDSLATVPSRVSGVPARGAANPLLVDVLVSLPREARGRPGEGRRLTEPPDIVDVDPDVDEATVAATRRGDAGHLQVRAGVVLADDGAVDSRRGSGVERRAPERVQG